MTRGTISSALAYIHLSSQKRGDRGETAKNILRNGSNFSKCDKKYKLKNPRNSSKISMKKATSRHFIIIIELLKTKEEILKAIGEKRCYRLFVGNYASQQALQQYL